jgi:GNAT superfamily N-acetyltransferase
MGWWKSGSSRAARTSSQSPSFCPRRSLFLLLLFPLQIARSLVSTILVEIRIRQAVTADLPTLRQLIDVSVRGLQAKDYTSAQMEKALATVYGVDTQLVVDGTYFVAEAWLQDPKSQHEKQPAPIIAGCGGWSKRKTLYGADHCAGRDDSLLDPRSDAAKIRAFFVHPAWARRGIGSIILDACERAARDAGFTRLEMGATLTGVPFYRARGYSELERIEISMKDGVSMPIVRMAKQVYR